MNKKRLYLLDATAFCYRAFYAIRGLSTSFGQPTGAIYGFLNILNKIIKDKKPDYLAACFDVSRDTFRSRKFAEYKIQRPSMPDDLVSQIPIIKEIIAYYGITIFEKPGYEADDLIATLACLAKVKGINTTIVSSDKDILQLVDKDIEVFNPYKEEGIIYDEDEVLKRFGVKPDQIVDLISLMGDAADNIASVPGIGEKTAVELIKEFGSVDKLLKELDKIKKPKVRETVSENIDKIKFNRELAVLVDDLDIDLDLCVLETKEANIGELTRIFKRLEFKKLIKDLHPAPESVESNIEVEVWDKVELKKFIDKGGQLGLCGDNLDNLVFYSASRFLRLDKSRPELKEILADPKIKKIGYDLKKLKVSLAKEDMYINGLYFDTMIAAYLNNPSKGNYSLEALALDHLDKVISGDSFSVEESLSLINELMPKLEDELKSKLMEELFYKTEMPLLGVLAEMEILGIKLDLKLLKSLSLDLEHRLIKLVKDIYKISGEEFNINSPKQLGVILFEKLKLPVVKKTKTGPSTDEEVLRKLADKHKLPAHLLEYRQLTKLKTTYIDALPQLASPKTCRIHTSFNQAATETGRLSSSNPNLQNIPIKTDIGREIRKAFIASSKDNCLIACDYSQIELRILAHLSKDERLVTAFKNGEDIHKATASLIYGLEEDKVSDEMRDSAKRINFGIVYGLTFYGLSRDLNIAPDQAQHFIDAYFSRYPGVKAYIDVQIEKAKVEGFVTTILGRRRYIPEITSKNQGIRQFAERQAVNTPIQGSASDLIKLAMISIDEEIKKNNLKSRMVLQIHDELVFDLPKVESEKLVALVRHRMENVLKLDVPVKVDIKMGQNWLEMEKIK
ncbi:MAG: DNA polymerase I [Candidatus Omnitrophica bacterium]|nr:DNA polymerase I [Candidatus Omnitrophota bacterium]